MARISITGSEDVIDAGRGSILDAALAAGVPFPHGCMSGECGGCKCRILSGEIRHDGHSPDALSESERAQGYALACRARPIGDVRLALPQPVLPVLRAEARVVAKTMVTHDIVKLTVALETPIAYRGGQFFKLQCQGKAARSYSPAHPYTGDSIEFHIRKVCGGQLSQHIFEVLSVGDSLSLEGPYGDAYWQGQPGEPLLLVAGGTGLAPIKAVLHAALADGAQDIRVYHGVRAMHDLYDGAEIAALPGVRYTPVLSQHDGEGALRTGHVHEAVATDLLRLDGYRIYVAGPPPMVDAVKALAAARGVERSQIHADAFHATEPARRHWSKRLLGWLRS